MSDQGSKMEAQIIVEKENPEGQVKSADQPDDIAELRSQLNAKVEEAKSNYDRYVRQVAELDNFKNGRSVNARKTLGMLMKPWSETYSPLSTT